MLDTHGMSDFAYKILLDRYALKDNKKKLEIGDIVIALLQNEGHDMKQRREIGVVEKIEDRKLYLKIYPSGDIVTLDENLVDKPVETSPKQIWKRVAKGAAEAEIPEEQQEWQEKFEQLLDDWKFVPGGRILTGAGTEQDLSFFNCMPPEQTILTPNGYRPIGDIQVGEKVVTHKNRMRKVINKFERETEEDLYVFNTKMLGFDKLKVTGEHKIYVIRSNNFDRFSTNKSLRLKESAEWVKANEIKKGDYVAIAHISEVNDENQILKIEDYLDKNHYIVEDGLIRKLDLKNNIENGGQRRGKSVKNELVLDENLCYLLGRWLGDGNINHETKTGKPTGIKIVFNLDEINDAEVIQKIIEEKFGVNTNLLMSNTGRWYDLWANSDIIGNFFKNVFGCYSYGKFIPEIFMNLSKNLTTSLLKGFFQANGYHSNNNIGMALANKNLAIQVHQLLMKLGYLFSIYENASKLSKHETYRLSLNDNLANDLANKFFGATPDLRKDIQQHFKYNDLYWVRITKIEIEKYSGTVIDIEVEEDHSFVSAGVVVSNCFVIPNIHDSRGGIVETLKDMMELMSRGGGVGFNISSLRPTNSYVKGVNGRSSGAVSFMEMYSLGTGLIQQAGCFAGDGRVSTDKGLIPIKEVVERMENGEVFYAQTHVGMRKITDSFRNGAQPLLRITTELGYSVDVTPNHPMLYLEDDGKLVDIRADKMIVGDKIAIGTFDSNDTFRGMQWEFEPLDDSEIVGDVTLPKFMTPDLAYFLGYSYGDGDIHYDKAVRLATADDHPTIQEKLLRIMKDIFNKEGAMYKGDGKYHVINLHSRDLIKWLRKNNIAKQKSAYIEVPEAIWRSDKESMMAFVAGYFDADGSVVVSKKRVKINSISHKMLKGVQSILAYNGIASKIQTFERKEENWQTIYELSINGNTHKERFYKTAPTCKNVEAGIGTRDMSILYSAETIKKYPRKYSMGIYSWGIKDLNVSANQLTKIATVAKEKYSDIDAYNNIHDILNTITDKIVSIETLDETETFDLTIEHEHKLCVNNVYTVNSRRGALMLIMDIWHPDIIRFIHVKRDMKNVNNANISVNISDKFMEALENNEEWILKFPDTSHPNYDTEWKGDIEDWESKGYPVIYYGKSNDSEDKKQFVTVPNGKPYKAKEIWDMIVESAWASAEPGLWFGERANKMSNSNYYPEGRLVATNPCVTGDTRIYTDKGLIQAKDLFENETEFSVTTDSRFGKETFQKSSRVFYTGKKPVFEIETKEGYFIKATANHQFMTPNGWKRLDELNEGDELHLLNRKGGFGKKGNLGIGRVIGWLVGDGHMDKYGKKAVLSFWQDERELVPEFNEVVNKEIRPSKNSYEQKVGVTHTLERQMEQISSKRLWELMLEYDVNPNKKHRVPESVWQGTEDMQRGFLQALFSADGSVADDNGRVGVKLAQMEIRLLEDVQRLLLNFGISSTILKNRKKAGKQEMPDGKGGKKFYNTNGFHEIRISKSSAELFVKEIGFLQTKKSNRIEEAIAKRKQIVKQSPFTIRVDKISACGEEDVYDLTEPITHSFVANGIVVHNCGEENLPDWGLCNLGAVNLAKFWDEDKKDVKWLELSDTVSYGVRFLDNIITMSKYHLPQIYEKAMDERRVGLGIMGLAELLIRAGIRYGSQESVEFVDRLFGWIAEWAYITSASIAAEKGAFRKYNKAMLESSGYMKTLLEEKPHLKDLIQQNGLRNVTLLTVAPTGTTGSMAETSTGIEPFFALKWERTGRLGKHIEYLGIAKKWKDEHPSEELPDYFVTAMELTPKEHVAVQAIAQKWVDAAISKTTNAPNNYTLEQTSDLYTHLYKMGAKGGTIYRDGSRNEQVLTVVTDDNASSKEEKTTEEFVVKSTVQDTKEVLKEKLMLPEQPSEQNAKLLRGETAFGTVFITISEDENENPYAIFINIGKSGSDLQAQAESMGRMFSISLQSHHPHLRREMLEVLVEQNMGIGGARQAGFGKNRVVSFPDAVAKIIKNEYLAEEKKLVKVKQPKNTYKTTHVTEHQIKNEKSSFLGQEEIDIVGADICPECKNNTLLKQDGCIKCIVCGYSEC